MATPTAPDLTNVVLPFAPASFWVAGDFDAAELVAALKAQPPLADFADEDGNMQSGVRLDTDVDPANVGYWVTVADTVGQSVVDAGVAAYVPPGPPAPPAPTPEQIAAQMAQTISSAVQSVPAGGTVADLSSAIVDALAPYIPPAG